MGTSPLAGEAKLLCDMRSSFRTHPSMPPSDMCQTCVIFTLMRYPAQLSADKLSDGLSRKKRGSCSVSYGANPAAERKMRLLSITEGIVIVDVNGRDSHRRRLPSLSAEADDCVPACQGVDAGVCRVAVCKPEDRSPGKEDCGGHEDVPAADCQPRRLCRQNEGQQVNDTRARA
jgi:hypothetical protein